MKIKITKKAAKLKKVKKALDIEEVNVLEKEVEVMKA